MQTNNGLIPNAMLLMRFRQNHDWFYLASNLLDRNRKSAIRIDINMWHSSCSFLRSLSDLTLYGRFIEECLSFLIKQLYQFC